MEPPFIQLDAHHCEQRRTYRVTFEREVDAVQYVRERSSTHAFFMVEDAPVPEACDLLMEVLDPICCHGLSERNCYGPDHYAPDDVVDSWYV
jgi:hypothetical protein